MIRHELTTIYRQAFTWLTPLIFFVIVVSLFPLALGADSLLLQKIAPGIIWVAALFAILIANTHLFKIDIEEGSLDLLLLSPRALTLLALNKIITHWIAYALPLVLISPLLGILLHLAPHEIAVLFLSLLLGTPILTMIGAIGSALTVGVRSGGLLLPILIMPLYIPVLIFGTSIVIAASLQIALGGYFAILGALLLFTLAFAPLLTGTALRIGVNQ